MSHVYNIGLVWANPFSPNLGVAALTYSALLIFEEVAKKNNIRFNYLIWGYEKRETDILISSEAKIKIITRPAFMGGDKNRLIKNLIKRPWVLLRYKYLRELYKQDYLMDIGEGDSYADIYGIERFRIFNYVKQKCLQRVPYILLPQTIGPFNSLEAQDKAKKSLKLSTAVIARDKQSYNYCRTIEKDINLFQSIDMAFFLPFERQEVYTYGKIRIGINISGLLWEGGYTKDNQFNLCDDYKKVIFSILKFLSKCSEFQVHLIGHVISPESKELNIDDDMHVLKEIKRDFPNFILAPMFSSPIEAKSYISTMNFFVGARMHACIAAISSGVPVLPMAYSRKFNGLFQDTLGYNTIVDLKTMSQSEILHLLKDALNNIKNLKVQIKDIISSIIEPEKEKLINLMSSFIK